MPHNLTSPPAAYLSLTGVHHAPPVPGRFWQKKRAAIPLFEQLSLRLGRHERVGLVGLSGCGKSTLLRLLLAIDAADRGSVHCDGHQVMPGSVRSLRWFRRRVQYIPQDPASSLPPAQRIGAIIAEPLKRLCPASYSPARVREAIAQVGLSTDLLERPAGLLSGGQAQRVAMARALVIRPEFLVADEPVSGLDLPLREQIKALLLEIAGQTGMGLLMVSHDISVTAGLCDRLLVMQQGRIIEDRPTGELLRSPQHPHTRELLRAVPTLPPALRLSGAA